MRAAKVVTRRISMLLLVWVVSNEGVSEEWVRTYSNRRSPFNGRMPFGN